MFSRGIKMQVDILLPESGKEGEKERPRTNNPVQNDNIIIVQFILQCGKVFNANYFISFKCKIIFPI